MDQNWISDMKRKAAEHKNVDNSGNIKSLQTISLSMKWQWIYKNKSFYIIDQLIINISKSFINQQQVILNKHIIYSTTDVGRWN